MCSIPTEWGERDPDKEEESKFPVQHAAASKKFLKKLNDHIFKRIYLFNFDCAVSSLLRIG